MVVYDSINDIIVGFRINFGIVGLVNWMIDEV